LIVANVSGERIVGIAMISSERRLEVETFGWKRTSYRKGTG
jgi:hypothetical protein